MLFFFFLKKENETNSNESTVRPSFSNRFLSRASSVFLLPGLLLISSWFYGILLKLLKLPNFIFSLIKHTSSHPRLRIFCMHPLPSLTTHSIPSRLSVLTASASPRAVASIILSSSKYLPSLLLISHFPSILWTSPTDEFGPTWASHHMGTQTECQITEPWWYDT